MKKITIILGLLTFLMGSVSANEVNIFSARHYDSDVQLYEKFTAKTGIKVNVISGKSGALEKRIIEEGADSKADLYITADAGRLGAFKAKGMLQGGLTTAAIKDAVPNNFRTSQWVGIAKRARIVYFSPDRVSGAELEVDATASQSVSLRSLLADGSVSACAITWLQRWIQGHYYRLATKSG